MTVPCRPVSARSNDERATTILTTYERPYGPQNANLTDAYSVAANYADGRRGEVPHGSYDPMTRLKICNRPGEHN